MSRYAVIVTWEDGSESVYGPYFEKGSELASDQAARSFPDLHVRVVALEPIENLAACVEGAPA